MVMQENEAVGFALMASTGSTLRLLNSSFRFDLQC